MQKKPEMETVQVEVVKVEKKQIKKNAQRKIVEVIEDDLDLYFKNLRLVKDELDQTLERINLKKIGIKWSILFSYWFC